MAIVSGDRWGSLLCTDVDMKETVTVGRGVTEHWMDKTISLKCDCGKEFDIPYRHFKGKRKMLDCGCGLSQSRAVLEDRIKCAMSMYVEVSQVRKIEAFAQAHGLNTSKACNRLIKLGLEYVELTGKGEEE